MSKIAILTDSTAYLPQALLDQYHIGVVPLKVIWGEENLDDGVDISPQEFYNRLPASTTMPTTSQVTVGEFQGRFEDYHAQGQQVLAILISSGISGTIDSANQARTLLPQAQIEIVDSLCTTLQLGFLVLAGARCASQGGSLADCKQVVLQARDNSGVVFGVDTLEYLYRGGRIGGGKRFMGTMLNIKPILTLNEGKVDALEQVRTRSKSMKRMVEIVAERTAGKTNLRLGVSHANATEEAVALLEMAASQLGPVETLVADLSPAIGTHVGPGTLALAYQFDPA